MKIAILKETWVVEKLLVDNYWLYSHERKRINRPLYRTNIRSKEYWEIP